MVKSSHDQATFGIYQGFYSSAEGCPNKTSLGPVNWYSVTINHDSDVSFYNVEKKDHMSNFREPPGL